MGKEVWREIIYLSLHCHHQNDSCIQMGSDTKHNVKQQILFKQLHAFCNRRSSEIQGTAFGKSLRAWTCIYRSMPAGVAQSRHAFVGGTVSTWGR